MARKVYKIPKATPQETVRVQQEIKRRKVAAYARVSTDHEEQISSYQTQVEYYTGFIQQHHDWQFVKVYTDEGISGTSTKNREGFKQMIEDALAGRIGLIITKSISRFARNTVDSLSAIRQLKEKGVEVYFEKENIYTLDGKGEVLLTIMSSLAQEESRSISENVTWAKRKRHEEGKTSVNYQNFLGYDKDFKINEDEARIVRQIYQWFLKGYSCPQIAKKCEENGYKSPGGNSNWHSSTVRSMLQNEKYKGDALLQKYYTADYLTKKQLVNKGEVQQYYVKEHHDPIIDPQIFDQVQVLLSSGSRRKGVRTFSGMIICGECGATYGPRTWHSKTKYKKVVWSCRHKSKKPHNVSFLEEKQIEDGFIKAVKKLLENKNEIITVLKTTIESGLGISEMENQKADLLARCDEIETVLESMSSITDSQSALRYESLCNEFGQLELEIQQLETEIISKRERLIKIENLLSSINEADLSYSEDRFRMMIESIKVNPDKTLGFKFMDGNVITVQA